MAFIWFCNIVTWNILNSNFRGSKQCLCSTLTYRNVVYITVKYPVVDVAFRLYSVIIGSLLYKKYWTSLLYKTFFAETFKIFTVYTHTHYLLHGGLCSDSLSVVCYTCSVVLVCFCTVSCWQFWYGAVGVQHTTRKDQHSTVQTHTETTQALEKLCPSVKRHVLGNGKYKAHLPVRETSLGKPPVFCCYVNCAQGYWRKNDE
jgi:hypothetical protein